jgi:hypothetical protein
VEAEGFVDGGIQDGSVVEEKRDTVSAVLLPAA